MDIYAHVSKVFAVPFLIFVSSAAAFGQSDSIYRLPAGTRIRLSMDSEIGSRVASVDDTFTATVASPIKVRNAVVLPTGTVVEGRVTKVSSARSGGRNGRMEIRFETIRFPDNIKRRIDGLLVKELKAQLLGHDQCPHDTRRYGGGSDTWGCFEGRERSPDRSRDRRRSRYGGGPSEKRDATFISEPTKSSRSN